MLSEGSRAGFYSRKSAKSTKIRWSHTQDRIGVRLTRKEAALIPRELPRHHYGVTTCELVVWGRNSSNCPNLNKLGNGPVSSISRGREAI